ncbi:MAG: proprotein convertase P-domain-containing protein [Kofleriaceae bacterium]
MRWLPLVLLVGCVAEAGDGDLDDGAEYASEMTAAEAARVLALVNYPLVDKTTLDIDAGLTPQAATSITAYRAGADGVFPSKDDNEIDGIPELDAIPNIGAASLQKLSAYASAHPAPQPVVVGSRRFLGWQAQAILWVTNTSAVGVLNGLLDDRAAANIVAARPYSTLAEVDAIPLVGPSAFDVFKGQSYTWWHAYVLHGTTPPPPASLAGTYDGIAFDEATATEALAIANVRTRDDMVAHGVVANGASVIVGNRPYTTLAQVAAVSGVGTATMRSLHAYATSLLSSGTLADGAECGAHDSCQSGLCVGLTVYPMGTCSPAWMKGTFSVATPATIPDGGAAITQSVEVTGLASVPEDLVVHLDIDHPRKTDLYIVLTQPSSAESLIWDVDSSGNAHVVVGGNLERDSEVNGTWTLSVRDVFSGSSGTLRGWSLELTSRYD